MIRCAFHSESRDPQTSNPSSLVGVLLLRLLEVLDLQKYPPSLLEQLTKLRQRHPAGPGQCYWKDLWSLFQEALVSQSGTQCSLVLDGLNECHFGKGAEGLRHLRELLQELSKLSGSNAIQVVIFSRPSPEYSDFVATRLRLIIDQGLNADDIQMFVSSAIDENPFQSKYKESILKETALRADGMFLWAKALLEYLNIPYRSLEFHQRLHEFPTDLASVYHVIERKGASKLNQNQKLLRRELFCLVIEAREPFSLDDLARLLGLDEAYSRSFIPALGSPLIEEYQNVKIRLMHHSVRVWISDESRLPIGNLEDTLFISSKESHARLARECLVCLLDSQYESKEKIGLLVRRNFRAEEDEATAEGETTVDGKSTIEPFPQTKISFDYAWRHWAHHLTSTQNPKQDLLKLAHDFLHRFHFVYWSEYSISKVGDYSKIREAKSLLKGWSKQLSEEERKLVGLCDYFTNPYTTLSDAYEKSREEDRLLQWLTRLHLGRYLWDDGTAAKAFPILQRVVQGLTEILGSEAPLTLEARTEMSIMYLERGQPDKARAELVEIVEIQRTRLGPNDVRLYWSLHCRGETELLMNDFEDCIRTQREAAIGFSRLLERNSSRFLNTQVWTAQALVSLGQLDDGLALFTKIWDIRRKNYGDQDIYAATVQYSMGDVLRKQKRRTESLENLKRGVCFENPVHQT